MHGQQNIEKSLRSAE